MLAKRRLGRTGLQVTLLGLGGIPITGTDDQVSDALINAALDAGINLLETSHAYGHGKSETKFGRVLKARRRECVLHSRAICKTPDEMLASLEASLAALSTDVIDIYGIHDINCEVGRNPSFIPEQVAILQKARDQGKIRYLSVSGHRQDDLIRAIDTAAFDVVMVAVNPLDVDIPSAVIPVARRLDLGVIAMKPFAGGLLTDRPDISLRYALAHDVSAVSAGMKSIPELQQNVAVARQFTPLTSDEREALQLEAGTITHVLGKHVCRQCGYCLRGDGCPAQIDIPRVFYIERAAKRYFSPGWAKAAYRELPVRADECTECCRCEERCPYQLPIREMLKAAGALLEAR